jgi:hypothetical protein
MKAQLTVKNVEYHRNGISGLPFYVGIVESIEDGKKRDMLVVRFVENADTMTGNVVCAAFDLAKLPDIRFMHNSFRGDHFHVAMDEAIKAAGGE